MHLVEQRRDLLNLVDDHAASEPRVDLLAESLGGGQELHLQRRIEEVEVLRLRERARHPSGFSRAARAEEEKARLRGVLQSGVHNSNLHAIWMLSCQSANGPRGQAPCPV